MDPGPQRAGAPVDAGPLTPSAPPGAVPPGSVQAGSVPPGSEETNPEHSHTNGTRGLNVHSTAYLDHGPLLPPKPSRVAGPPLEGVPPDDGPVQLPHQEVAQTSGPPFGGALLETIVGPSPIIEPSPAAMPAARLAEAPTSAAEGRAAENAAKRRAAGTAAGTTEGRAAGTAAGTTESRAPGTAPGTAAGTAESRAAGTVAGTTEGRATGTAESRVAGTVAGTAPAEITAGTTESAPAASADAPATEAAGGSAAVVETAKNSTAAGNSTGAWVAQADTADTADIELMIGSVLDDEQQGPDDKLLARPHQATAPVSPFAPPFAPGREKPTREKPRHDRPGSESFLGQSGPMSRDTVAEIPAPPTYSSLAGGTVPGDPTNTYGALFTQRLRALLPWPTAEDTDPLGPLLRAHKMIHSGGDVVLLRRAYGIAEHMHRGQMRKSGEPFISHPLAVAQIVSDLGMDTTTLVAALLHDTVEDTSYTLGALERDFGSEVALLVDGVTKFDKVFYGADAEAETIRKMIVSAGRDVRVLVIKLADRLHNMRTLDARSRSSQVRIATATRDVLIPLCDRLGIQALKRELEDWVLRAINPSGYALVEDYVRHRKGWDEHLVKVTAAVDTELSKFKINANVTPRPRHLYSIWKDTVNGNFTEAYDLPRVVIIVDGPDTDCYAALGAVHSKWRPTPGRFKDFIASPKNNLYRSLHTTVLGPDERTLEVLIRTEAMHRAAEYGIVANFRYPHHASRFDEVEQAEQLDWLRRLLDWETAAADPAQFIASLRCDLAEGQILVFTSTGRPILLPTDSTPVDLAYVLGADIGNRCIGARLNGRLISVSAPLADGDTVEIVTRTGQRDEFDFDEDAPARGPSPEWLDLVKTPHARLHISRWFADREAPAVTIANKVRLGRLAIGLALRQRGRGLTSDLPLVRLLPRLDYPDLETLLVAVADHVRTADEVVDELIALVDHSPH
jgi:guanosine-3',5'-bis(diphosphate) 3'-pyrophosphohydrolase